MQSLKLFNKFFIDDSFIVYRCPRNSDRLKSLGCPSFPEVQFTRFTSNAAGNFVLETNTGEIVTKTSGFDRLGDAYLARGQAIQRQTDQLVQETPECVAIE